MKWIPAFGVQKLLRLGEGGVTSRDPLWFGLGAGSLVLDAAKQNRTSVCWTAMSTDFSVLAV
jgi:hypothetical protein